MQKINKWKDYFKSGECFKSVSAACFQYNGGDYFSRLQVKSSGSYFSSLLIGCLENGRIWLAQTEATANERCAQIRSLSVLRPNERSNLERSGAVCSCTHPEKFTFTSVWELRHIWVSIHPPESREDRLNIIPYFWMELKSCLILLLFSSQVWKGYKS